MTGRANKLHLQLQSRIDSVETVCVQIAEMLQAHGLSSHLFAVELVARELLNNAILHGNCLSADKHVDFFLSIGRRWICLQVSDEGEGYNWRHVQRDLPAVDATSGRGISIARLYAQRLRFSADGRRVEACFDQTPH